jgi:diaminopimelate epimerase
LTLTKHQALGNDFLVALDPPVVDGALASLARRVCDRRRGVGADGLLVGRPLAPDTAEPWVAATMVLFNADGTRAEMSGNGVRCFAQAIAIRDGLVPPARLTVHTDAGLRTLDLEPGAHPDELLISVDMGAPAALDEPTSWSELGCDPLRPVRHLSMGNPHSVVAVDSVAEVDLGLLGSIVPDVNLEIIEPGPERHGITMRVHERGAGITAACGTGASASAWAAVEWGLATSREGEIVVHMDGGDAKVRLDHPVHGNVTLVGPTEFVATVTVRWNAEGPR